MQQRQPPELSRALTGYVLAGGRSSRMGRDKALLELAGKPLLQHAVEKLRQVCSQVFVLGANASFAAFAPIVPDLHPDCGPLSGLEAALTHNPLPWSLLLPVDLPFLPADVVKRWVAATLAKESAGARVSYFTVDGVPQPALALVHRELLAYAQHAIELGRYKLSPVLKQAAEDLAQCRNLTISQCLLDVHLPGESYAQLGVPVPSAKELGDWFTNLNTPMEFAEAEKMLH